jgi:hypothetical protein
LINLRLEVSVLVAPGVPLHGARRESLTRLLQIRGQAFSSVALAFEEVLSPVLRIEPFPKAEALN